MARGLALVLQHQRASADRRADYIKHRQQIQHRQSMMDRDARNRQMEQERRNQWQSQDNYQRFQQQSQLYQEKDERDQMQQQQKQSHEDQKRRDQYEKREQFAKTEIDRIQNHPGLSEEQKRSQVFNIERELLYDQADSGPPKDVPWYVGTEKDIGMVWWEDTDEVKPDTLGGGKWRVRYTRTNRGDAQVLFHERERYFSNLETERGVAKKEATEEEADRTDRRNEWKLDDIEDLEWLLEQDDISDADKRFIASILRKKKKEEADDEVKAEELEWKRNAERRKEKAEEDRVTKAAESDLKSQEVKEKERNKRRVHEKYRPIWNQLQAVLNNPSDQVIDKKLKELGLPAGIYDHKQWEIFLESEVDQAWDEYLTTDEGEKFAFLDDGGMSGMGGTGGMNLVPNETGLYELA